MRIAKKRYVHFTEQQKDKAININLELFLQSHGYKLELSGKEKRLIVSPNEKSITVCGNEWYDHATEKGGNPISLVQKLFNVDWLGAMELLVDENTPAVDTSKPKKEKKPFILSKKDSNNNKVMAYLTKERCINENIISHFIGKETLYQNIFGGAVFIGADKKGVPKIATIRGTNLEKKFQKTETGSDRDYGFAHVGVSPSRIDGQF